MADEQTGVKISGLPAASSLNISDDDILAGVLRGITSRFSLGLIKNFISSAISVITLGAVPDTRTINSKALSNDIILTASDVEAVPTSREINNKTLSSDILLNAEDIGAAPSILLGTITLSSSWSGSTSPYSLTVTVSSATVSSASKVDLLLTPAQIDTLMLNDVTGLLIENDGGTLTAYALGAQPDPMTILCTVMEVSGI